MGLAMRMIMLNRFILLFGFIEGHRVVCLAAAASITHSLNVYFSDD